MIGETIKGIYKIYDEVGAGSAAEVYMARNTRTNQIVAIKIIRAELTVDGKWLDRFRREAKILSEFDSPNALKLYDYGTEGDLNYIVTEFVQGMTLAELIQRRAPLEVEKALDIAKQVASCLQQACQKDIVHRDIKPSNIMVTTEGVAKVMDFGVARSLISPGVTQTGVIGTPYYISPEQAEGGEVDSRSDIYSLGATLFEMLTGEVLYTADSAVKVILKHLQEPIPSVRAYREDVPPEVEAIVTKCLAKKPEGRFRTPMELIAAINNALRRMRGEAVPAPAFGPAVPQAPRAEAAAGTTCPKCGTRLRPGAAFCSRCGHRLEVAPPPPPVAPPPPAPAPVGPGPYAPPPPPPPVSYVPSPTPASPGLIDKLAEPQTRKWIVIGGAAVILFICVLITIVSVISSVTEGTPTPLPPPTSVAEQVSPTPLPPTSIPALPADTPMPIATDTLAPAVSVPTPTPGSNNRQRLDEAWARGDWPEAIRLLEENRGLDLPLTEVMAKLYEAHVKYGQALMGQGRLGEAEEQFNKALEVNPDGEEAKAGLQQITGLTASPTPLEFTLTPTPGVDFKVIYQALVPVDRNKCEERVIHVWVVDKEGNYLDNIRIEVDWEGNSGPPTELNSGFLGSGYHKMIAGAGVYWAKVTRDVPPFGERVYTSEETARLSTNNPTREHLEAGGYCQPGGGCVECQNDNYSYEIVFERQW